MSSGASCAVGPWRGPVSVWVRAQLVSSRADFPARYSLREENSTDNSEPCITRNHETGNTSYFPLYNVLARASPCDSADNKPP